MINAVKKIFKQKEDVSILNTQDTEVKYPYIKTTETTDFKKLNEVVNTYPNVLLYVWAPWCGPCRMSLPTVDNISAEDNNIVVVKVNADSDDDITIKLCIHEIPTYIMFKNGAEINRRVGSTSYDKIMETFNK